MAPTQWHSVGIAYLRVPGSVCLFLISWIFSKKSKKGGEENNHSCMPSLSQAYQRGAAPKSRILPAGGKVLTSEEEYNLLSDRHFPDPLGELLSILSQGKFLDWLCLGERHFTLQGRRAAPGNIFGCHSLGGWRCRHVVGRGPWFSATYCNAQNSLTIKNYLAHNIDSCWSWGPLGQTHAHHRQMGDVISLI